MKPVMDFESEECKLGYNTCWPIGHYLPSALHSNIELYDYLKGSTCFSLWLAWEACVWSDGDREYMGLGFSFKYLNREGVRILQWIKWIKIHKNIVYREEILKHLWMLFEISQNNDLYWNLSVLQFSSNLDKIYHWNAEK